MNASVGATARKRARCTGNREVGQRARRGEGWRRALSSVSRVTPSASSSAMSSSAKTGSYTETCARSWRANAGELMSSWEASRTSGKTHYSQILAEGEEECELRACVTRSGGAAQAQAEHVLAAEAQRVH